jgi:hypothetical protein
MPRQAWAAVKGLPVNPLSTSRSRGGCRQTAEAIAAVRTATWSPCMRTSNSRRSPRDWTGKPLRRLAKDPMWRMVQVSR